MAEPQSNNIPIQSQNNDRDAVPTNFSPETIESYNEFRESYNEVYNKHVQTRIDHYIPKELRKLVVVTEKLIRHGSRDPYVRHKVQQAINQTTSKIYDGYEWTKNSAAWAKDKTVKTIYDQYGFAKDKASQGITAAKEQIPWDKINQIATVTVVPAVYTTSNIVLPNLVNLYRRSSTPTPPSTEEK